MFGLHVQRHLREVELLLLVDPRRRGRASEPICFVRPGAFRYQVGVGGLTPHNDDSSGTLARAILGFADLGVGGSCGTARGRRRRPCVRTGLPLLAAAESGQQGEKP